MDPASQAKLYRSRAHSLDERASREMEEIAAGPLAVMVRLALTDPDADFWPYRIDVGGSIFDGEAIVALDRQLRGPRKRSRSG
jgi:hypothetical protein